MTGPLLRLTRDQILRHRRTVGSLDARMPAGPESLRRAAWAGLQDSMPRAALLSIHGRVAGAGPATWEDSSLVQLWGPRYSTYVVARTDVAVFTLGRLPDDARGRQVAQGVAARLHAFLDGRRMTDREAGEALAMNPNGLRYGAPTGTVLIRWEGARAPVVWTVPPPDVDPAEARLELARRYLHVFGPATAEAFAGWAGIGTRQGLAAFVALESSMTRVRTPIGDAWILAEDEPTFRETAAPPASARLLPSGDAYYLLHGADRELLVPEPDRRAELWTSRVWPGAVLVEGEIVGTWRRAGSVVTISSWRPFSAVEQEAIEAEASTLPVPGLDRPIRVHWDGSPRERSVDR
ncbi:MAG: DNA glycosylase AlkZ-like family protein [Chloroflexota bacterium]